MENMQPKMSDQIEKDKYHMFSLICGMKQSKIKQKHKTKNLAHT